MRKIKKILLLFLGEKKYLNLIIKKNLFFKFLNNLLYLTILNLSFFYKRLIYQKKLKTLRFIPVRQLVALDILLEIKNLFRLIGINFFLLDGTLLGAVRQESFAGRPNDIDLGIKEKDYAKLLNSLDKIEQCFKSDLRQINNEDFSDSKIIRSKFAQKNRKFYFIIKGIMVDFSVFCLAEKSSSLIWEGETFYKEYNNFYGTLYFEYNDLNNLDSVKLFDNSFYCPKNKKDYLIKLYGENWLIPIKKQFCWKKN